MSDSFNPYHKWLGIPSEEQPPNYYRLLGLPPFESEADVIQNAANQRMAHIRTFQAGERSEYSEKLLNELSAARQCLLKADRKAKYDEQLRKQLAPKPEQLEDLSAPVDVLSEALDLESSAGVLDLGATSNNVLQQPFGTAPPPEPEESPPRSKRRLFLMIGSILALVLIVVWLVSFLFMGPGEPVVDGNGGDDAPPVVPSNDSVNNNASGDDANGNDGDDTPPTNPKPTAPVSMVKDMPAGHALRFDQRDYVLLENSQGIGDLSSEFTAEAWCRWSGDQQSMVLFGPWGYRPPATNPGGWFVELSHLQTGRKPFITFYYPNGKEIEALGGGQFQYEQGKWHHLAICNSATELTFFYDGQLIATEANSGLHQSGVRSNTFSIGSGLSLPTATPFHGEIGGFRLSRGVLYDGPFTPQAEFEKGSGTEVLLDFSQPVDRRINDLSGNDRHGQIVGATWAENDGTPVPSNTKTVADSRTIWRYREGDRMFRKNGDRWVEELSDQQTEAYYEVDRIEQHVEIAGVQDAAKHYRLTPNRLVRWNSATSAWTPSVDGGWEGADTVGPTTSDIPKTLVPSGTLALQLHTHDYFKLTSTKGILEQGNSKSTVEMWMRLDLNEDIHAIIGDNVWGPSHDDLKETVKGAMGWLLYCKSKKDPTPEATIYLSLGNKDHICNLERPADWHHIAFCRDGRGYVCYIDGESALSGLFDSQSWVEKSPIDLFIGYYKFRLGTLRASLNGEIAALRISSSRRYEEPFSPPPTFVRDQDTLRLFDFSKRHRGEVPDISGYNMNGLLSGTKWVTLDTKPIHDNTPDTPLKLERPKGIVSVPIPTEFFLTQARETVQSEFGADFARAQSAEEKKELAQLLFERAIEESTKPEIRYVLLDEAQRLTTEAGLWELSLRLNDEMGWRFENLDVWPRKIKSIGQVAQLTTTLTARKELVEVMLELVNISLDEQRVYAATDLAELAFSTAARAGSPTLRVAIRERRLEVDKARRPFDVVRDRLKTNPSDVRANLNWGKFECLIRRDWATGLVLLAKGDEPKLKSVAEKDLSKPSLSSDQIALAKAWRSVADSFDGRMKESVLLRARRWYQQALGTAIEVQKPEIQTQLQEIDELLDI